MNLLENSETAASQRLEKGLKDFMQQHSPGFLSRNIRRMTLLYVRQSLKEGIHSELPDFLDQLDCLLDFLDLAEEESYSGHRVRP